MIYCANFGGVLRFGGGGGVAGEPSKPFKLTSVITGIAAVCCLKHKHKNKQRAKKYGSRVPPRNLLEVQ